MRHKSLLIIMIFVLAFLMSSCSANELQRFYFHRKDSNNGTNCAVLNDKIYYYSDEGKSGVYSMDLDGGDINLECEADDLRQISILDDVIYYLGLEKVNPQEKFWDKSIVYSLYKYEENEVNKIKYSKQSKLSAYDACFTNDGLSFIYDASGMFILEDDKPIHIDMEKLEWRKIKIGVDVCNVVELGGYYIFNSANGFNQYEVDGYNNTLSYFIDKASGEVVMPDESPTSGNTILHFAEEEKLYVSQADDLYIVDLNVDNIIKIDSMLDDSGDFVMVACRRINDSLYCLVERLTSEYIPDVIDNVLIQIDANNSVNIIKDTKNPIVYFDGECCIEILGSCLVKTNIKNNKKRLLYMGIRALDKNHYIDYAGDWLFVYQSYVKPIRKSDKVYHIPIKHLVCRINMSTNKVYRNKEKFDISRLMEILR